MNESQLLTSGKNIHIIAKVIPFISSHYMLDSYLLCEEVFCYWEKIEKWVNYYWNKSECCYFFTQDTYADFILIDYTSFKPEIIKPELPPATCWDLSQIRNFSNIRNLKIKVTNILFSYLVFELYQSKEYRHNLLCNIYSHYIRKYKLNDVSIQNPICSNCNSILWNIEIFVSLKYLGHGILDNAWNSRVHYLVHERCELETAMAWLSTLGGAFSALGDEFIDCAEKAGIISFRQLKIALRLGDPLTVCRCQIYVAMSLLQRGYYKKTKYMIRKLYKFSVEGEGKRDFRLKNMCIAVWNKLKYLKSLATSTNK